MEVVLDVLIRGSDYVLIAAAITLFFSVARFANVALVECAVLGAVTVHLLAPRIGLAGATAIAMVSVGVFSLLIHRVILERLAISSPAAALIGSMAIALIVRSILLASLGSRPLHLDRPVTVARQIAGVAATESQMTAIAVTAAAVIVLIGLLYGTKLGLAIRALAANPPLAAAAGLDAGGLKVFVGFLCGAMTALAGVLLMLKTDIAVNMGHDLMLPVFAIAILGGIGSPIGALAAAVLLAFTESVLIATNFGPLFGRASTHFPINYLPAVGFAMAIMTLRLRPQGLFSAVR